jgi:hypothetical protein
MYVVKEFEERCCVSCVGFSVSFFLKLCSLVEVRVGNTEECNIVEKKVFLRFISVESRREKRNERDRDGVERERESKSRSSG